MSGNAITQVDDSFRESSLELLPPARRPVDSTIEMLRAHADMMDMARDLASKMVVTQMVPKRFQGSNKSGDAAAAILYGAELGLNPIQALQRVIPIHGMPSLEARTMVALLKSRGYVVKTRSQSDESVTVFGRDLDGDEYETTWTIERAKRAGYVPRPSSPDSQCRPDVDSDWVTVEKYWDGKKKVSVVGNMKYITDPQAMLKAKGQAEVCREIAPEVLLGIGYTREDLESERWDDETSPRHVESERDDVVTVEEILGNKDDTEPKPKGHTRRVEAALAKAEAAAAAAAAAEAEAAPDDDATPPEPEPPAAPEPAPEVISAGDEPSPDPSDPEPTGDDVASLDMGDDPGADDEQRSSAAPEPVRDDRPATREQLQELTQLIAAGGFQPTDEGREQWFAWLSDEVGRDIRANNQLTRWEISKASKTLKDDTGN